MPRAIADRSGLKVLRCPTCGSVLGQCSNTELFKGNGIHRQPTTFDCAACAAANVKTEIKWRPGESDIDPHPATTG